VLVNRVFLLFSFIDADVEELDEISEDELPRCSCKFGALEKLLPFTVLTKKSFYVTHKLYHRSAKLDTCSSNLYETTILSNCTY
jgi:hypothetical protein